MKYLLGIDFGGGASKATLIDTTGKILAEHTVEYPTYYPEAGACEQKPQDWIAALCEGCKALLTKSGIQSSDILAVAVDSATHTFLLCDETDTPLMDAIHWTDLRSRKQADALFAAHGQEIFEKTYHKPSTIWTLPQLIWLKEHHGEIFSQAKFLFFEKDYIRYFLTGVYCTDYIEAEGSMFFDCNKLAWDETLCRMAGLPAEILPPIVKPTDVVGTVTKTAAELTGLCEGTKVICGTTDTAMEVFAAGAVKPGDMTVKLATAGRICVITDRAYPDKHLVNYSHIAPGLWYPGTATKAAASSYRWYRDTFGETYDRLNEGAAQIAPGAEGLLFHPYLKGELTPFGDPSLRGSFMGIGAQHTKAHFTRAVLEGVSFSLLDCKKYLDSLQIPYCTDGATLIGGGAKGTLWSQITADVLGIPLRITENSDSSLGSAMLAGIACGVFADAEEAAKTCIKEKRWVQPDPARHEAYREIFTRYQAVQKALAPLYNEWNK